VQTGRNLDDAGRWHRAASADPIREQLYAQLELEVIFQESKGKMSLIAQMPPCLLDYDGYVNRSIEQLALNGFGRAFSPHH
jgi:hypothetical protein